MKRIYNSRQEGYITLISVLIVGAVGVAVATTFLLLGLGISQTSFAIQESYQAKALASLCAEEALQLVRISPAYVGSGDLVEGNGSCRYVVLDSGLISLPPLPPPSNSEKTIRTSGAVGRVVRYFQVSVDQINPQINITSWQEVPFAKGL